MQDPDRPAWASILLVYLLLSVLAFVYCLERAFRSSPSNEPLAPESVAQCLYNLVVLEAGLLLLTVSGIGLLTI